MTTHPLSGVAQFLTLPLPPSINCYWRKSPRGMYITKDGKTFRQRVAEIVAERNAIKFGAARLCVAMHVSMRDRRVADVDNRIKAALDALTHAGVYDDDSQIDELFVARGPIVKGGRCEVMVMGA
jgi:crossover junction endodeoxyribonuclease RusA